MNRENVSIYERGGLAVLFGTPIFQVYPIPVIGVLFLSLCHERHFTVVSFASRVGSSQVLFDHEGIDANAKSNHVC